MRTALAAVNRALRALADGLLERLLPRRCLLCGAPGGAGLDLCQGCASELPWNVPCCARCAIPLPAPVALCGRCQRRPPPWAEAVVPLRYAFPVDRLEARFKFGGELAAGALLAALWLRGAAGRAAAPPAVLVPVPLAPRRLAARGFNQALELARPIGRALGIPVAPSLLERIRDTAPQSGLDRRSRARNVRGAFRLKSGAAVPESVALVDDVLTTGATARACARALAAGGARRIVLWAIARAGSAP